jgi:hypothetical protein
MSVPTVRRAFVATGLAVVAMSLTPGAALAKKPAPKPKVKRPVAPAVAPDVEVTEVTESTVTIEWDSVSTDHRFTPRVAYRVEGETTWKQRGAGRCKTTCAVTLEELEAETPYEIRVRQVGPKKLASPWSELDVAETLPLPEEELPEEELPEELPEDELPPDEGF